MSIYTIYIQSSMFECNTFVGLHLMHIHSFIHSLDHIPILLKHYNMKSLIIIDYSRIPTGCYGSLPTWHAPDQCFLSKKLVQNKQLMKSDGRHANVCEHQRENNDAGIRKSWSWCVTTNSETDCERICAFCALHLDSSTRAHRRLWSCLQNHLEQSEGGRGQRSEVSREMAE